MTTQPEVAVGNESPVEPNADPKDVFEQLARDEFGITEEEDPVEGEPLAEDDAPVEEEADDLPPIEPPVSWDAEAKDVFKSLPRDAQEVVQKREAERERFVQQKSQEATRAKTEVQQAALQQLAEIEKGYAEHYSKIAEQILPQRPNPVLLDQQSQYYNPSAFYAQQAGYENAVAQQRELQQLASQHTDTAKAREAQAEQARYAEESRTIVENFPEYADPTTGPKLQAELTAVAKEMGYSEELISQARANDILAMRKAMEWRADSLKLKELNKSKMEKVRAAKGIPPVSRPGVAQGGEQLRVRNSTALKEVMLTSKDRNVQGAAFMELAKSQGWVA